MTDLGFGLALERPRPRGQWSAGKQYRKNDLVSRPGDVIYIAVQNHFAGGDFVIDRDAGKWFLFANPQAAAGSGFFQKFSGTGSSHAFTLTMDLGTEENNLLVFEDVGAGVWKPRDPSTYTVSGTTFTINAVSGTNNVYVFSFLSVLANLQALVDQATAAAATATTKAGISTTQAGIATTQAGIATSGANTATTQAGIAVVQAGIATAQAAAALASQIAAAASALSASGSQAAAAASAGTATTQAGIATTAANTATTKATEASDSAAAAAASATKLIGTSTTSVAIAVGPITMNTQTGKFFGVGNTVLAVSNANPDTHFMTGTVSSYSGSTLNFASERIGAGTGSRNDWTIYVTGKIGTQGYSLVWRGAYDSGINYNINEIVSHQNSSWVCINPTIGVAPPTLPTTTNAKWQLMATAGTDALDLATDAINLANAVQAALDLHKVGHLIGLADIL